MTAESRRLPPIAAVTTDMRVGAYYFPGWCEESRWYCIRANRHTQHPLLGYYREGSPEVAEWHIRWALEHGVSFFAYDYYMAGGAEYLEAALRNGLLRAPSVNRFRFCIDWCDHRSPDQMTADEIVQFADHVVPSYVTHPSYLRLDGRPVVMFLGGAGLVNNLGVDGARKAFDYLRSRCVQAGAGDPLLVFNEGYVQSAQHVIDSFAAGAQAFCLYNYPYAGSGVTGPGAPGTATYAQLTDEGIKLWRHWRTVTEGRFWPTVMPGWDRRPWLKQNDLIRTGSTPALFETALQAARQHVNAHQIVMVEAWNEWGEGSVLEPSVEHRFGYLDAVRRVFAPRAAARHRDLTPSQVGSPAPCWDGTLPSITRWGFDLNTQGWTAGRVTDFTQREGALYGVAATGDPCLNGPISYVEASTYRRCTLRMKLSGPAGQATAQLFWSTVDTAFGESNSAMFPVQVDGHWHVYDIVLANRKTWKGLVDQLRLDPVDRPDVAFGIDFIELEN